MSDMEIPGYAEKAKPEAVQSGFTVYPKDDYDAMVTKFAEAHNDKCGGKYYQFQITILKGPFQNGTTTLMLAFNSPEEWSRKESATHYANLCNATGVRSKNGNDYVNKPFRMSLDCYKKKGTNDLKNKITNIVPLHNGPSGPAANAVATSPSGSPQGTPAGASPWGSQSA